MIKCIHIAWQYSSTSSHKPFQIKDPKYDKYFWITALVLNGWKCFKEEFLLTALFLFDVL